ncbi:hypothetical protein VaNZ11_001295 [Volvox africanus]|uniref:Uncharacterized protein n=1 Tax=Volvox africanus TaxID=51714 RepID=A0ABQ5RPC8_9CHLO|nr:hypothetical protein VaNZ11_001295 [Volvox africanus]
MTASDATSPEASLSASTSSVSRMTLLGLFEETFDAVRGYRTSNPAIYTGSAGVALAIWHARRSLVVNCSACTTPAPAAEPPLQQPMSESRIAAPTEEATALAALPSVLLAAALEHARSAVKALVGSKGYSLTRGSRGGSMLDGAAGVHMTAALVLHDAATAAAVTSAADSPEASIALLRERDDHVRGFLDAYPLAMDSENDEYLYGRAGYLQGAQLLNCHLGAGTVPVELVEGVATEILESGRELAARLRWQRTDSPPPPLFYMWPHGEQGEPYLGAAHGLIGILFSLLHCDLGALQHAEDLRASLAFVASHEMDCPGCSTSGGHYPTRMAVSPQDLAESKRSSKALVHWCHGAPGAVFMWCKAHQVFGDPAYLSAARRAGEVVWQLGLLKKGHGLCHGTSGNAYALLTLHRATGGEAIWLHRARMFAAHMGSSEGRSVLDTPDRPLSLYEGRAGALCLLADLLADDGGSAGSRFPAFELP